MQTYVIERYIPGAGRMSREQLREAAQKSNQVLDALGPGIRWQHSYVTGDKLFCVYEAEDEALVHEHARQSGFPASRVTPVSSVIDPATGR